MRLFLVILVVLMGTYSWAEDMHKYLSDTEEMVQQGKYQEALDRFIWFHDHSLEHEPSMYGVRLSFALSSWKELSDVYPPAKKAMEDIRDQKTQMLENGKGDATLFDDVESLNDTLGDNKKTIALFELLDMEHPSLAKRCWHMVKEVVIAEKRFDIARKYIGNPVREFNQIKEMYEQNVKLYDDPRIGNEHFKAFNENHMVEQTIQLIQVAIALGDQKAAREIQQKALAIVEDYRLVDAVPKDTD
jgi:hypothetical protein